MRMSDAQTLLERGAGAQSANDETTRGRDRLMKSSSKNNQERDEYRGSERVNKLDERRKCMDKKGR